MDATSIARKFFTEPNPENPEQNDQKSENPKKWYFIDLFGFGFSGLGNNRNH
uniref:Uncharacterized protein n=1 Tax=Candidatus Kentrum sp. UNK TaxID=2126344 RepID=A0A451ARQ4_9GAMM|nr:MAG: hypothetical protein BECKUNK1418G_GA0071005_12641 [Candidatus Kentron sp. UNK]